MKKLLVAFIMMSLLVSCQQEKKEAKKEVEKKPEVSALYKQAKETFAVLPKVAESKTNPVTDEKVALGKSLYFDNILSKNHTESCNTCHNLDTYGVDNKPVSPGDKEGTFGSRNSPTTLNAAFHIAQFWDGREPDVEAQAGGPVLSG